MNTLMLAVWLGVSAAQDAGCDTEERFHFDLGLMECKRDADYAAYRETGLRLVLNEKHWKVNDWTADTVTAESRDKTLLVAWYRPMQVEPSADHQDEWVDLYRSVATSMYGAEGDIEVKRAEIGSRHGKPSIEVELAFDTAKVKGLRLVGAGFPVKGATFHVATAGHVSRRGKAVRDLNDVIDDLEIRTPADDPGWGGQVELPDVIATTLPAYWRLPLPSEKDVVARRARDLGLDSLAGCWAAIHPRGPSKPDIIASCVEEHHVGPIDSYTEAAEQAALKAHLFGDTPVPDAELVELADRNGLLYAPDVGELALFVAAVPQGRAMTRTWVLGDKPHADELRTQMRQTLSASSWSVAHEVQPGEWAAYYVMNKPWHPYVWSPVCCSLLFLGGIGGLVMLGLRRKPSYELDDEY